MRRANLSGKWQVLAFLLVLVQAALAQSPFLHSLPLVKPASNATVQGFIRIINHSDRDGTVQIRAIDDTGERFGPVTLAMEAKASRHFNSDDLESGNADKGLSDGVGDGDGDWRLELETTLDIEPLAYIRTEDGFVTSMHDLVVQGASMRYHVPFFNPGSNQAQVSQLRLINTSDTENEVTIVGLDDDGQPGEDNVRLTLPGNGARTVSAQELEDGGSDLPGGLGDGKGKWHLFVSAEHPVHLLNMLRSPTGNLTNLSTSTSDRDFAPPGFAPADQAAFDRQMVGNQLDAGDFVLDFVSDGRFDETGSGGSYEVSGSYSYTRVDPDTGTLNLTYDSSGFAGGSCTVQLTYASSSTGTWSYTCVSGAQDQGTWRIAQTSGPDLVVQSASVTDSTPDAGASFTLSATVRNQGSARSAATTLRYYRSSDATISTSDTAVGTDAVSALAASGTEAESIRLTAPRSADTYYYGACVDAVSRESNSRNNCSTGVRITVSGGGSTVCDSSAGEVDIPDAALRKAVEDHLEMAPGTPITPAEMASLTDLRAVGLGITNLKGLECATALEYLSLVRNELTQVSLSHLPALRDLRLNHNQLTQVSLSDLPALYNLHLHGNQFMQVSLSHLPTLAILYLANNELTQVSLSHLPALRYVYLEWNELTQVSLSDTPALELLDLGNNQFTQVSLPDLPALRILALNVNQLTHTQVSLPDLPALELLALNNNQLTQQVPLPDLPALESLSLDNNQLTQVSLSDMPALESLGLDNNQLTQVSLSYLPALDTLHLRYNELTQLSLSYLPALDTLYLDNNQLTRVSLDLPALEYLHLNNNQLTRVSLSDMPALRYLDLYNNPLDKTSHCIDIPALEAREVTVRRSRPYPDCEDD